MLLVVGIMRGECGLQSVLCVSIIWAPADSSSDSKENIEYGEEKEYLNHCGVGEDL